VSAADALAGRHVVVLGLMASGKTSFGRELAGRLGRPLRDSDPDIEAVAGADVRTLAATEGVAAMHEREAQHLLGALASAVPSVVTAAASIIDREECRAALAGAATVWLDVAPSVLARRFDAGAHRPTFGRPVSELLVEQHRRRAPLFAGVATVVLHLGEHDTDGPARLAERALRALVGQP
jgi:shikimate kinase